MTSFKIKAYKIKILYFLFLTLSLSILGSFSENSINYETFVKSNQFNDISSYARFNGFPDFDIMFAHFKIKFNRSYTGEEEERRKFYFLNSLKIININKKQLKIGHVNYELGINKFADFSPDEYSLMFNNWSRNKLESSTQQFYRNGIEPSIDTTKPLPRSFDWRDEHIVTRVKDQGFCGSCWAFAGIATIESAYALKHNLTNKDLIELSEQQMVSCTSGRPYRSRGCAGGTPLDVYRYASDSGVVKEENYPYQNKYNQNKIYCGNTERMWKIKIGGYSILNHISADNTIMHTIYNNGPVAVLINAGDDDFKHYQKGILSSVGNQTLLNNPTNHWITCIGWGTENGTDFWILKNSWGKDFGEDGYVRIKRALNSRGFNTLIVYPTLTSNSLMIRYSLVLNISIISSILIYLDSAKIIPLPFEL